MSHRLNDRRVYELTGVQLYLARPNTGTPLGMLYGWPALDASFHVTFARLTRYQFFLQKVHVHVWRENFFWYSILWAPTDTIPAFFPMNFQFLLHRVSCKFAGKCLPHLTIVRYYFPFKPVSCFGGNVSHIKTLKISLGHGPSIFDLSSFLQFPALDAACGVLAGIFPCNARTADD